jgi:hypothetical protein
MRESLRLLIRQLTYVAFYHHLTHLHFPVQICGLLFLILQVFNLSASDIPFFISTFFSLSRIASSFDLNLPSNAQ